MLGRFRLLHLPGKGSQLCVLRSFSSFSGPDRDFASRNRKDVAKDRVNFKALKEKNAAGTVDLLYGRSPVSAALHRYESTVEYQRSRRGHLIVDVGTGKKNSRAEKERPRKQFHRILVYETAYHEIMKGNQVQPVQKTTFKPLIPLLKLAQKLRIPVEPVSKWTLNYLCEDRPHQNIVLECSEYMPLALPGQKLEIPYMANHPVAPLWLALDQVVDPQNLGAILRTAFFFDVDGVIVSDRNSAKLSPVVSKASSGALELMNVHVCPSILKMLRASKDAGWRVLGTSSLDGYPGCSAPVSQDIFAFPWSAQPSILVMGNEGFGMRNTVAQICDDLLTIPAGPRMVQGLDASSNSSSTGRRHQISRSAQLKVVESLNVSVATGALLHAWSSNAKQLESREPETGEL